MGDLLKHIKGLAFGLLLGSVMVATFNLDSSYILSIAFFWVVIVNIYYEFLVGYFKKKNDKDKIARKLNLLEKKRYVLPVQEYVTTKRDLTYEFNNFQGEKILKTIDDCQHKYKLNDILEESIIKEFEHRIEKLIAEKLLINNLFRDDINLQKVIIERIMLLFDSNIIVNNFGIDNKPSKIELLETRLDFLSSYDNWKDERISQIIKFTKNEKLNELLSDKKTINAEIRSIYLENIEDALEPSRFRMKPDTYLKTKQYLINTYNVANELNLDLPETIDEDEILKECKYRVNYIYNRFIDELIKKKKWQIKSKSGNNDLVEADLDDSQIIALKDKLGRLDMVNKFFEKHNLKHHIDKSDYSFLKESYAKRFLEGSESIFADILNEFQDALKSDTLELVNPELLKELDSKKEKVEVKVEK